MDKSQISKVFIAILVGAMLTIPFWGLQKLGLSGNTIMILTRIMYSIGIIIFFMKIANLIARIFLAIVKGRFFWISYIVIEVLAVCLFIDYSGWFEKGYLWIEIVALVLCSVWVLIDMNTARCERELNQINNMLEQGVKQHSSEVEQIERAMAEVQDEKNRLIDELEPYVKKSVLSDPLKNIRQDIDFPYLYKYLECEPQYGYLGTYAGFGGLVYGMYSINRFQYAVDKYVRNMKLEGEELTKELERYRLCVKELEIITSAVKHDGKVISDIKGLQTITDTNRFDDIIKGYEKACLRNIDIAKKYDYNFKKNNKIHKKLNKVRRRKRYERSLFGRSV